MKKLLFLLASLAALALGGCGTVMTLSTPTSGDPAQGIDTLNQDIEYLQNINGLNVFNFVTYQRCAWAQGYITTTKMEPGNLLAKLDPRLLESCAALEGFYRDLLAGKGHYCVGPKPTTKYVLFYEGKGDTPVVATNNAIFDCTTAANLVRAGGFEDAHYVGDNYSALCGTAYNPPDHRYHSIPANDGTIGSRTKYAQPGTYGYAAYQAAQQAKQSCPSSTPDFAGSNSYFVGKWIPMSYVWHYIFTGEWPFDASEATKIAHGKGFVSHWPTFSPAIRAHLRSVYEAMRKNHPAQ